MFRVYRISGLGFMLVKEEEGGGVVEIACPLSLS